MFVRFLVPMRPISVNKMHTSVKGRIIKTSAARSFEFQFNHYLAEFSQQAILFVENFNEQEHSINVEMIFYINRVDYFNKQGLINKRCLDVDNNIKTVQDQVFRFLSIDDALVTRVTAVKVPSDKDATEVIVRRVNLNKKTINPQQTAMILDEIH